LEAISVAGFIEIQLNEILQAKGMTQKQLAEMTGIRPARISQICRGFVDRLELDHITKICDALQVSPWTWIVYTSEWMFEDDNGDENDVR
jgi:putative transcriptional regulator